MDLSQLDLRFLGKDVERDDWCTGLQSLMHTTGHFDETIDTGGAYRKSTWPAVAESHFGIAVALYGQTIIGAVVIGVLSRWCVIWRVAIEPQFQGQGIGKLLMRFTLSELRAHSITKVQLFVHEDNVRANALYDACGFVQQGNFRLRVICSPEEDR